MIITGRQMTEQIRSNLKGGNGDIHFTNFVNPESMKNCRLLSKMSIPVGASIGEHTHINETEYYIILDGCAKVIDNGLEQIANTGEVIVTGPNCSHSIFNIGDSQLIVIAIIITH